jgi:hypothetical protein
VHCWRGQFDAEGHRRCHHGAVTLVCPKPVFTVSVTVNGGTLTTILLVDSTTNAQKSCPDATSCSLVVTGGDRIGVVLGSGDGRTNGTPFSTTCAGEGTTSASSHQNGSVVNYTDRCPTVGETTTARGDFPITVSFG